jgi:hypothetical protein
MQSAIANERDDLIVRDQVRLMYSLVGGQQFPPTFSIAYQQFSINQFVSCHFIKAEEPVQLDGVRSPIGKKPNPHGCVHQDHQATLPFADRFSRRLGTSRA